MVLLFLNSAGIIVLLFFIVFAYYYYRWRFSDDIKHQKNKDRLDEFIKENIEKEENKP